MKFVLSLTILGFLVLSCKKTENSTTPTSDSTVITDDSITTAAPMPNDTTQIADTTTADNATRTNTMNSDSTQITK
ncbi:hypothetical protein SAMN05443633_10971 [Chryseobacterium arachidis]|uniref:Uncharacterized protein n=1 Tax=Chryseobacterium arachidis TaxID=1416778 RepID=A0A1M5GB40_9FLAO|nr:hypothetical protein [Chryseobacterium arachidis]SHG00898.1 hypothetical protein SAMN05443633_10971 [Chryseobacterium arachidis]